MDALTAQTIRRLCERLEVFRVKGPIPALMAEHRVGDPPEDARPLRGFANALSSGAVRHLPDGSRTVRKLWLNGDMATVAEFRTFCRDAAHIVLPELRAASYLVGDGADDHSTRWVWAVFELAELRLPGTFLRLVGDTVWRVSDNGVEVNEAAVLNRDRDPLCAALAANVSDTRYWKLADAVEASIAALDIAQLRPEAPTPPAPHQTAAAPSVVATAPPRKPAPRPRGEPAADLLRRLWATPEGKQKILDAGSAARIAALIGVGKTAVIDAGAIWNRDIAPALKARRSMASFYRSESRRREEEGLNG